MPKKRMDGFQKPIDTGKRKEVRIAVVKYGEVRGRRFAECSCGKPFTQPRAKVLEDAIDRHITTKHNGRGVRL